MEQALDVSNYTGIFGAEAVACWRSSGYAHIICGTQRPPTTRAQLAAALAGGLTADAYCFLYWDAPMRDQVVAGLAAVAGFPGGPDIAPDFDRFRPYGGWTRPAMWQFQGTTQLCSFGVDLNLREAPIVSPRPAPARPPPPPELDSEPDELAVLRAGRRFLRALLGGRYRFRPLATPTLVQ